MSCPTCGKKPEWPRRKYCSDLCRSLWLAYNGALTKGHQYGISCALLLRHVDGSICQDCGGDLEAAREEFDALRREVERQLIGRTYAALWTLADASGMPYQDSWIEYHHLEARRDGGGDMPDNLLTLCARCHGKRTAEQRRQWAGQGRPGEGGNDYCG